ncbi:sensor histidine kinase [Polaromonas aquatica]|uniref:sensor histidine kinase n=1 Tax=Polaromonas aquatica TaxID=332657 RepID=UPI003D64DA72
MRFLAWLSLAWGLLASAAFVQPLPITLEEARLSVTISPSHREQGELRELGRQPLPWKWDQNFPRQQGVMHFTLDVPIEQTLLAQLKADGRQGLGVSSLQMGNRYRYRINGKAWHHVGWNQPNTQFRTGPRWQLLAAQDLQEGVNILEIDIRAEPASNAGLARIEVGDEFTSLAEHEREVNHRKGLALMSGTLSALIGLMALALWWQSRDKAYLVTGLGQACFVLWQVDFFIDYPPVPTWVFNAARSAMYAYYAGLMCWVSVLLVRKPAPWLNRLLQAYLWTALPTLVAGAALQDYRVYERFWIPASLLLGAVCMARYTHVMWKKSDGTVRLNASLAGITVAFGLYDLVLTFSPSGFGRANLLNYSFLFYNFAVGMMMVRNYWSMQNRILKLRYEGALKVRQATMLERQRLMQDIHDSVGSQLVALVSLVNSSAPREVLRTHTFEVLDELRIAVDAIENVDGDLAVVLATMRHRLQPRLDSAGVSLVWEVDALPRFELLTPKDIQHIQRILLEVFTNIIQHAKATRVVFAAHCELPDSTEGSPPKVAQGPRRMIRVSISDDGIGMGSTTTRGRGLANMQSRAEMLGATLAVTAGEVRGTTVSLAIPLH